MGTYTVRTRHNGPADTVLTNQKWAGNTTNCLAGPAIDSQIDGAAWPKDSTGFPKEVTYRDAASKPTKSSYAIKAPGVDFEDFSNVRIANYFEGTIPPIPTLEGGPVKAGSRIVPGYYGTNPYYQFICDDSASDKKQMIRVAIRSWSAESELLFKNDGADFKKFGPQADPFSKYDTSNYDAWPDNPNNKKHPGFGDDFPGFDQ